MTEPRAVRRVSSTDEVALQLLVALAVVVLAQTTRMLFPIMYEIGEDWDFVLAGLVALGAFSAPLLVMMVPRLSGRTALVGGSGLMAGAYLAARISDPIPSWLAITVVVLALVGVTVIGTRSEVPAALSATGLVSSIVLGMTIDVVVRALFGSWDLAWQPGTASLVVVLALAAGLVGLAVRVGGEMSAVDGRRIPAMIWVGLGGYFLLQLLFVQNFAFVASQGQTSQAWAVFAVLVANLAAIAVAGVAPSLSKPQLGGVAAVAVALAWAVSLVEGIGAVLAVFALQPALSGLLARAAARSTDRRTPPWKSPLAAAGGSVLFLALVLIWSLHIDQPLPVPRQTIPAFAALIVGIAALTGDVSADSDGRTIWRLGALSGLALALATPVLLVLTAPDLGEANADAARIDIVSYNARGSVGIDGQLAPDETAREILTSSPDVVVIQEAARGWPIHGTLDLVSYLERELAMEYVYVAAADGQFGNAIFSKLPMTEISRGVLPKDGSQERSYVLVRIDTGTTPVHVVGTHLEPRSVPQVNALLEAVVDIPRLVVAGDMNIAPNDPEIGLFADAGLVDVVGATGDECRTTSAEPTSGCDRPDWVFVTPDLAIEQVRIGSGGASDHLAIHVTLAP